MRPRLSIIAVLAWQALGAGCAGRPPPAGADGLLDGGSPHDSGELVPDAGTPAVDGGPPRPDYDPTPPPGDADCARDWDTFDPGAVYLEGVLGADADHRAVLSLDDPTAYTVGFDDQQLPTVIRPADGKLLTVHFVSDRRFSVFNADPVNDCTYPTNPAANDTDLPASCANEEESPDIYLAAGFSGDGLIRCGGHWRFFDGTDAFESDSDEVIAVDGARRLLVGYRSMPLFNWRIRSGGEESPVEKDFAVPIGSETGRVRVFDDGFRFVIDTTTDGAWLVHIPYDGSATVEAVLEVNSTFVGALVLDAQRRAYWLDGQSSFVWRTSASGGPEVVYDESVGPIRLFMPDLLTGP